MIVPTAREAQDSHRAAGRCFIPYMDGSWPTCNTLAPEPARKQNLDLPPTLRVGPSTMYEIVTGWWRSRKTSFPKTHADKTKKQIPSRGGIHIRLPSRLRLVTKCMEQAQQTACIRPPCSTSSTKSMPVDQQDRQIMAAFTAGKARKPFCTRRRIPWRAMAAACLVLPPCRSTCLYGRFEDSLMSSLRRACRLCPAFCPGACAVGRGKPAPEPRQTNAADVVSRCPQRQPPPSAGARFPVGSGPARLFFVAQEKSRYNFVIMEKELKQTIKVLLCRSPSKDVRASPGNPP